MVIPSGRRSSAPTPLPQCKWQSPQESSEGGHHDGAETQQARLVDCIERLLVSFRSASSAKSIIMMAFFFTMPMSR